MKDSILKLSLSLVLMSVLVLVLFGSMAVLIHDRSKPQPAAVQCGMPDPVRSETSVSAGETLFRANCARCHFMQDKKLVGPGLLGITERGVTKAWLADYLRDEPLLYASGDTLAIAARKRAGKAAMDHTPFTFSTAEMDALYTYLQTETGIRYN
ncbi:MAG: c-type cytochrome [Bacteroidia bacterium]|nr:c-type cytochrome [Bacteroidia bacterium]